MAETILPTTDVVAIHSRVTAFYTGLDRFDDEAVASMMAPDFKWIRANNETVSGLPAIRNLLAARSRARVTRHLVTNIEIRCSSADAVKVNCDVLVFEKDDSGSASVPAAVTGPSSVISVSDELIRLDGGWKFVRKQARTVFKIDSRGGLPRPA